MAILGGIAMLGFAAFYLVDHYITGGPPSSEQSLGRFFRFEPQLISDALSGLAGMTAAVVAPIAAWATGHAEFAPVLAALAALVLVLHRANIARLLAGTEPKVGGGKAP